MNTITVDRIKELREKTDMSIKDCRILLEWANGCDDRAFQMAKDRCFNPITDYEILTHKYSVLEEDLSNLKNVVYQLINRLGI